MKKEIDIWTITDECYWYNRDEIKRKNHWIVIKNKKGKKKQLRAGSQIIIFKEKQLLK